MRGLVRGLVRAAGGGRSSGVLGERIRSPLAADSSPWRSLRAGPNRHETAVLVLARHYPVVIINWVQYLGPPGPFSFPDSRDLLEVLGGLSWQRERGGVRDTEPS